MISESKFDILILCAEKDYNKLKYVFKHIKKHIKGYNQIYCISPSKIKNTIKDIKYFTDNEVLKYNFNDFNIYQNWYKQQFIKLFQKITKDNYLVIDADAIIMDDIKIYENNKPTFFLGRNQYHKEYFYLMKQIFGLGREYNHSFISEIMLFKRSYIKDMLEFLKIDEINLIEKILHEVKIMKKNYSTKAFFSEYETYGNYIVKYKPKSYNFMKINTLLNGKKGMWSDQEIEKYINDNKNKNYKIITIHSWI